LPEIPSIAATVPPAVAIVPDTSISVHTEILLSMGLLSTLFVKTVYEVLFPILHALPPRLIAGVQLTIVAPHIEVPVNGPLGRIDVLSPKVVGHLLRSVRKDSASRVSLYRLGSGQTVVLGRTTTVRLQHCLTVVAWLDVGLEHGTGHVRGIARCLLWVLPEGVMPIPEEVTVLIEEVICHTHIIDVVGLSWRD
jgi:hypothetical protein